jgi:GT2 family glycosyltransferase
VVRSSVFGKIGNFSLDYFAFKEDVFFLKVLATGKLYGEYTKNSMGEREPI